MPRLKASTWEEIKERWEDGESYSSLSRIYNVAVSTIKTHRRNEGWIRPGTSALDSTETVTESSAATLEETTEAVAEAIAASQDDDEVGRLRAELAEAHAKLAEHEPTTVDWITDLESAEQVLGPDLDDLVEARLEEYNRQRFARGLAGAVLSDMPDEWIEQERNRILQEAVDNLTASASDEGPETRTQAWRKPDGNIMKIPYDSSIGNFAASPVQFEQNLKAKGFVKLAPQPCIRNKCWAMPPADRPEMFDGYCGPTHRALDEMLDTPESKATVTESFMRAN